MKYPAFKQQGGFTLIELAVVIGLLSTLVLVGSKIDTYAYRVVKANYLLGAAHSLSDAVLKYKNDTGVTPKHLINLYSKTSNSAVISNLWHGPYIKGIKQDESGDVLLWSGSVITLTEVTASNLPAGINHGLQLNFSNLPDGIVKETVKICNNSYVAVLPTTFKAGNNCAGTLSANGIAGSVKYLIHKDSNKSS